MAVRDERADAARCEGDPVLLFLHLAWHADDHGGTLARRAIAGVDPCLPGGWPIYRDTRPRTSRVGQTIDGKAVAAVVRAEVRAPGRVPSWSGGAYSPESPWRSCWSSAMPPAPSATRVRPALGAGWGARTWSSRRPDSRGSCAASGSGRALS